MDDEQLPSDPNPKRISVSRVLSLLVVAAYLAIAMILNSPGAAWKLCLASLVPFASIWWPETIANLVNSVGGGSEIDPPVRLIVVLAWIALLTPVWAVLIVRCNVA